MLQIGDIPSPFFGEIFLKNMDILKFDNQNHKTKVDHQNHKTTVDSKIKFNHSTTLYK